ncbi:tRNA threonylcarbamoyladenosine dehydratase [Diplonema papillatum]|nr:tRNA threonylcarbamoyladenosine dehydratase [Diplonema papillatum]
MPQLGIFERTYPLLGEEGVTALINAHALVCGVGGVGGYAAEALARAGVGALTLVDHDVVTVSNKNRQVIALDSTVGRSKVQLFAERVRDINAQCQVTVIDAFLTEADVEDLLDQGPFDYIVDCIDTTSTKIRLLELCAKRKLRVVSSMGAGGKMDPTRLLLSDIFSTENCGLAARCRKELKKRGVPPGRVVACWSAEPCKKPLAPWPSLTGGRPRAVNGTLSYIPSAFGLMLAGAVIHHAATGKFPASRHLSTSASAASAKQKKQQKQQQPQTQQNPKKRAPSAAARGGGKKQKVADQPQGEEAARSNQNQAADAEGNTTGEVPPPAAGATDSDVPVPECRSAE